MKKIAVKIPASIKLPAGKFEIDKNCSTCIHANKYDRDDYGRIRCEGGYGGYNRPDDRNGCFYWEGKY